MFEKGKLLPNFVKNRNRSNIEGKTNYKDAVMTKTKKINRPTKTTTARATKVRQKRRIYNAQLGQPTKLTTS